MKLSRRMTVFSGVFGSVLAASVAFAAWTANGTGTGSAQAGSHTAVTVAGAAVTTNLLYPNGSGDVKLTFTNPNPYKVLVTQINNGSGLILSGDATCDASNGVAFANQTGTWTVPAKSGGVDGSLDVLLTNAASMSNASVDACQGETFTIPVSFVAASTP